MRKLILMAALSFATAFSFAQNVSEARIANPAVEEGTPGPSSATESVTESTTHSFGKWLGHVVKAPVSMAKSFVSGVKSGYNGESTATATSSSSRSVSTAQSEVPASEGASTTQSSMGHAMASTASHKRFSDAFAMVKSRLVASRTPAPVEERSTTLQPSQLF